MYLCLSHICRSMARNQGYRLVAASVGDFSNNGPNRPNNPLPQSHCSQIRYTIYLRCGFFLAILDWLPAEHPWSPCDGRGSQKESQFVRPMSKFIIHRWCIDTYRSDSGQLLANVQTDIGWLSTNINLPMTSSLMLGTPVDSMSYNGRY